MPTIQPRGHEKLPDDFQSKPSGDKSAPKTVGKVEQAGSSVKPSAKSTATAKSSSVVPASLPGAQDTEKQKTASAQLANAAAEVVAKRKSKQQQVVVNQDVAASGSSTVSSKKPVDKGLIDKFEVEIRDLIKKKKEFEASLIELGEVSHDRNWYTPTKEFTINELTKIVGKYNEKELREIIDHVKEQKATIYMDEDEKATPKQELILLVRVLIMQNWY